MDVIYPSDPAEPVPLMLQVTSTKERGKWINQRAYYIYGLLTAGYAGAIMDWNGTGPGAAPGGDVFPEKRAARLLRARAGDWNLSGRLGVTGHSKGSSRAGKAAFINEGNWEADRGPYAEQSDRFQVALLSAGQHAPEFLIEDGFHKPVRQPSEQLRRISTVTYVTPDDPPVFLSVGALDRPFRVAQMKRLADQCKKVGVEHRVVIQEGMGHMYNPKPQVIGHIFDFFDRYLKPRTQDGHAPVDQRELDRLANQVALTPQSTGDTARSSVEAKSYSGVDAFAIAALESIGAVVEVEGTGSEQFAVKVDLRSGKVTDAELEHVKRLTRLRELRLDGVPVTDDGLKHLQGMTSLQRLDLPNTRITDNGLSYLRELKNLRALSIKDNRVTDAGLRHLQGLTQLEMLSLGPNQISDIGVKSLQDLTKLRYLNLTDTQVTDSVFEYLKPLTSLRTLRLRGTRVTEKGVQDMKQMLPDCNVSR